jgi:hypothetical protein
MIYPLESAVSPDLACQVFEGPSWGLKSPAPRLYEVNQSPDGHSCPLGAGARLQTNGDRHMKSQHPEGDEPALAAGEPAALLVTTAEVELIAAAVQHYRDLLQSPTSADRDANGDEWAEREAQACDHLFQSKLMPLMPAKQHGEFFIMYGYEKTVDSRPTLVEARTRGQQLCDEDAHPTTWSIHDAQGEFLEDIKRTDGKTLDGLMRDFNSSHR